MIPLRLPLYIRRIPCCGETFRIEAFLLWISCYVHGIPWLSFIFAIQYEQVFQSLSAGKGRRGIMCPALSASCPFPRPPEIRFIQTKVHLLVHSKIHSTMFHAQVLRSLKAPK